MRRHRALQLEERLQIGPAWRDGLDLMFTNAIGGPIGEQTLVSRSFRPLLERAGLPRVRFHDLRHTAATLLLAQECHPNVVQELLGHSSIAVTMDIYSHVMPTPLQREAAEHLDRALAAR